LIDSRTARNRNLLRKTGNNYPWGKKGSNSLAAKYAAATPGGHFKIDESKEYAEVSHLHPMQLETHSKRLRLTLVKAMDGNLPNDPFISSWDRGRSPKAYQRE
jgi:hypothetical protein